MNVNIKPNGPSTNGDVVLHESLTLVETDDPLLLIELLADPRIRAGVAAQLSPTAVMVASGGADTFVQQLIKAGHTPKVNGR